jgi:2-iminobutanoate/2-iminopropanoate deaminase
MAHITRHNPASVHAPSSGYSMGLELSQHRRLLCVSGQVPENSDGSVPEDFEAQCEQAWRNVIEPASTVMIAETVDGKWLLEIEAIAAE